jgi:hypothetical protein
MQYPLPEKIGLPELFVGRDKEFANFNQWVQGIARRVSKSRVILAQRKSGKTAFVQRLFNQLWSENGAVIPFYLDSSRKRGIQPHQPAEEALSSAGSYPGRIRECALR